MVPMETMKTVVWNLRKVKEMGEDAERAALEDSHTPHTSRTR
jgi:hypothetical protein